MNTSNWETGKLGDLACIFFCLRISISFLNVYSVGILFFLVGVVLIYGDFFVLFWFSGFFNTVFSLFERNFVAEISLVSLQMKIFFGYN